jgi:glycosyltransferase involved in cell wall biosynthesis
MNNQNETKPWVLIPAYQPDEKLIQLIKGLSECGTFGHVLVVNDGSSPDKTDIFKTATEMEGVTVLVHAVNRGKGQALKTGMNHFLLFASPLSPGIVCCDADGQHLISDIVNVSAIGIAEDLFTLGVRNFGKGTPFRSKLGNSVTSFLFTLFTGYQLKDTQTGLRFFPRKLLPFFIQTPYDRFDYEFASLVKFVSDYPGQTRQVPIETVYLEGNASSHYRSLKDSITIGGVFLRFFYLSISTAALDYLVFIISFYLTTNLLTSFIFARVASVIYNFIFSRKLVFKAKSNLLRQLLRYLGLVAVFMLVSWQITDALSRLLWGNVFLSKIIAECGLFLLSFVFQRHFVFAPRKRLPKPKA